VIVQGTIVYLGVGLFGDAPLFNEACSDACPAI
jgi:hypothetical protein